MRKVIFIRSFLLLRIRLENKKLFTPFCGKMADVLDMDAYKDWMNKLYDEWPISSQMLPSGRIKKKNAGEVSITILAEVVSWYYPETETLNYIFTR